MILNKALLGMLVIGMAGVTLPAQVLQTLVSFDGTNGATPTAALTLGSDGNFYGTTAAGGADGVGTLFRITTNGALATLYSFTNDIEVQPNALTEGNDGNFYGTTLSGGPDDLGIIFKLTPTGTLTTLTNFDFYKGFQSKAALTLGKDGNFYSTTEAGGADNSGTVFKVTTNGTWSTLFSFYYKDPTNGDDPATALTLGKDGSFYGTTSDGGFGGYGTVFTITTNGTLTTLLYFNYTNGEYPNAVTLGNDGNLYGTTYLGQTTVFRLTTNGIFTPLGGGATKSSLALGKDGCFYGTSVYGGDYSQGSIFQVTAQGAQTTLYSFNGADGFGPEAPLTIGADGSLYGTTQAGGSYNYGTVFRLSLSPVILVQPLNQTNVDGTTVTFTTRISGVNPLRYQWQKDGTNLVNATRVFGANSNNLTITDISAKDGGGYSLIVSNFYGVATSSNASLIVITRPTLALQMSASYPLLTIYGTLGDTYTVEYSTNLAVAHWTPIITVPNLPISPFQMIDPTGVGKPARFYRAVLSQ